jgi:Cu2+-exporting ATPase
MKTVTLDVGGMFSMLDYLCVEKQLSRLPGVQRASGSIASGSVTVEYDETVTSVTVLKDKINECGFHCTGQIMPRHVCKRHSGQTPAGSLHAARATAIAPSGYADRGPPAPRADKPHVHTVHAPAAAPSPAMPHDMAHEMGHGAGMDMAEIVCDMRNRFWISLIFTVPIFIYSPMGNMFTRRRRRSG